MSNYPKVELINQGVYKIDNNLFRNIPYKSIKLLLKYKVVPIRLLSKNITNKSSLVVALNENLKKHIIGEKIGVLEYKLNRSIKAYFAPNDQIKKAIKITKKECKKYYKK